MQKDFDFLYFITTLQAQFDYIPMNRKLIPVEEELFTKNMYVSYLKNNEEKAPQFIGWAKQKLIDFADPRKENAKKTMTVSAPRTFQSSPGTVYAVHGVYIYSLQTVE